MAPPKRKGTPGESVFHDDEWWSWINGQWRNDIVQPDAVIDPQGAP